MQVGRYQELSQQREKLFEAMHDAYYALFSAREELMDAIGTPSEPEKQAALSLAEKTYVAADADLEAWLESPDGDEWDALDDVQGVRFPSQPE